MNETIAERIRRRRISLGMTQDELAKALGYRTRSSITKIESGVQELTQKNIAKIAEALSTTPSYIMGWEEIETGELSTEEKNIISMYRCISREKQTFILQMLAVAITSK